VQSPPTADIVTFDSNSSPAPILLLLLQTGNADLHLARLALYGGRTLQLS
jgi:hypothetical protein